MLIIDLVVVVLVFCLLFPLDRYERILLLVFRLFRLLVLELLLY